VALVLYPLHTQGGSVTLLEFVLFLGVAMSITALPVLARILTERGMQRTPIGVLALACAAIDDVIGWSLLAIVVAVAAGGSIGGSLAIMGWTLLFVGVMFFGVRPLLARLVAWHERAGRLTPDILAVVLAGLFLSAWVTDLIGVHAIFGAFLFGAIMPRREAAALTREILERLEQVSLLLLLPVFFVVAGLQVDIGAIGLSGLWQLGLILAVAIAGKFLGAWFAARTQGMSQRQSTGLGVLMNTRGLTELVILQVGVQLGVLDPTMFTLMVIMALVTTAMTGPLMAVIYPERLLARDLAAAERAELGEVDAYTVLAVVDDPADGQRVAELARDLTGREHPARVVLCRLLPQQVELEVASGLGAELGLIAAAGDELRVLARELEACGTPTSVVARFAADPAGLAATLRADLVLLTGDAADHVAALAAVPETTVVVARLGDDRPRVGAALALVDGSAGGRAVLRVAAHLALRTTGEVAVDGRRGSRRMIEALGRRGVVARAAGSTDVADAAVVVLTDSAEPPVDLGEHTPVLWVRPSGADVDDDLDQALGRIAVVAPGRSV
jgi:Kef-type K+ transport system membrane component KefB